ncbi:hypothetical protein E2C05_26995 [Paracraurococcus ruber]|nr:hypothetical protein [Paracraurococcus ruber]TDG21645.1 hypothetical protein E2C05_26995 [Paracraurococcus ruber]
MRRRHLLPLIPACLLPLPALAETPAERASRELRQDLNRDRAREAGGPEGPLPRETSPGAVAIETDRRSLQPDIGRPEEAGAPVTAPERGFNAGGNTQR